jgi:hypothetical protein
MNDERLNRYCLVSTLPSYITFVVVGQRDDRPSVVPATLVLLTL